MVNKIKVIAWGNPSGSRIYRMEQIAKYLNRTGKYEFIISPTGVEDEQLKWADIIFLQSTIDPRAIADAWAYKIERGKKIVVDFDDTIEYKEDSPLVKRQKNANMKPWLMELAKIADLITVTTQTLKDELSEFNKNIHVLPNYLDLEMWKPSVPNETGMIRVGWSGSLTHKFDLWMIASVIKRILKKYDNVKFLSCGDPRIDDMFSDIDPIKHESIKGTSEYLGWPMLARTLAYDIAIAPLEDNHFNQCKSYLKYEEYSALKIPAVYSPVAYSGVVKDGVNGFIAHNLDEWEKYLTMLIEDSKLRQTIRKNAYRDVVRNHDIAKNIGQWDKLYFSLLDN
jgi:glycosyltransferase involved in cell wall biosynthesis